MARGEDGRRLPLELSWSAPSACPSATYVTDRVTHLLSKPSPDGALVMVTAHVRGIPGGRMELTLTTEVAEARGTRTVSAGSCAALAEAAAVFIALAIDASREPPPQDVAEPPPPSSLNDALALPPPPALAPPPASAPAPASAPPATSAPPPARPPPPASAPSLRPGAGLHGVLDIGALPNVAPGVGLDVHVRVARVRAGLAGSVSPVQQPTFDARTGAGASVRMRTAGFFGCYAAALAMLELGGCATAEVRFVDAAGVGIRSPELATAVWTAVGAGGLAEVHVTRWLALVARVDALASIGAPTIALATARGNATLFRSSVGALRTGLGIEIVLP